MNWLLAVPAGLVLLIALAVLAGRAVNGLRCRIRGKSGVQRTCYLPLGGAEQYVQIRREDRSNPILLVLHGGPGNPMACWSFRWQRALERSYTVVHWDQRGCGNTYYRSREGARPTLELLLSDLDDLIGCLCREYGRQKVILLGHSWGTFLGALYAGQHPEKVSACLAVGQMIDLKRSAQVSAQEAMRLAEAAGRGEDVRAMEEKLRAVLGARRLDRPEFAAFVRLRELQEGYLPSPGGAGMVLLYLFSPSMTWNNLRWMLSPGKLLRSNSELYQALLSEIGSSLYDYGLRFRVPVVIFAGERDWTTPASLARQYFQDISAPYKEFIVLDGAGHIPFLEQPGTFVKTLQGALERIKNEV